MVSLSATGCRRLLQRIQLQCLSASLFHCQFSKNFGHYIPNIPDFYFDHINAAEFRVNSGANLTGSKNGVTYIFTISPEDEDCNGTVTALEMCYQSKYDSHRSQKFGEFILLKKVYPEFFVLSRFFIEANLSDSRCADPEDSPNRLHDVCCETFFLNVSNQFDISSLEDFSFGIRNIDWKIKPLRFRGTDYDVRHFQITSSSDFPLHFSNKKNVSDSLLILRFLIAPHQVPSTISTPEVTYISTSRSSVIGGTIGVLLIIFLVAGITTGFALIIRHKCNKKEIVPANQCRTFGNVIYEKDVEYADIGPDICKCSKTTKQNLEMSTNFYAESGASQGPDIYDMPVETKLDLNQKDSCDDENIYMVPASDEDALQDQLDAMNMQHILRQSVSLGVPLGSGQFGEVFKAMLETAEGKVEVAVKTLKEGAREEDRVKFLQEAAIMGQFKHFNVVNMYGVVTSGEPILLVLEFLTNGDLRDFLLHTRPENGININVDNHTLLSFCRHVASGMAYLSGKGFVHRDLAARNILVSDDQICKIADFGMSRDLMYESYYVSHGGMIPVKWTAPEALHYKKYSTASDVWSFGAVMYEIWSVGHKPFETLTNNKVISALDSGYRLPPPPGCPRRLYSLMIDCWHPNSSDRPSFMDLCGQLSLPDSKLLQWLNNDKSGHPEACKVGADLKSAEKLYKDMQSTYKKKM